MKKRCVRLLILSSFVIFSSTVMGCGPVNRSIPLDETKVSIVISPNFDIKKHQKVAVMPIYGERNNGVLEAQASDVFAAKLMEMGFTVVERTQIQRIFNELQLSMSGMLSKDELNKIGKLLNIDMIVMGTASEWNQVVEGYRSASIRFVDTVTGEQLISMWSNKLSYRSNFTSEMAEVLKRKLTKER
jgi:curli biogenesis system outer membrane secretion channel CsgG